MTERTNRSTEAESNSPDVEQRGGDEPPTSEPESISSTTVSDSTHDDTALEWADGAPDESTPAHPAGERDQGDTSDGVVLSTRPTIKPVLLWLGATVVLGGLLSIWFFTEPDSIGDPQVAAVLGWVTVLLVVIVGIRLLVRMYVLTRTRYVITESTIRHEFSLWYRRWNREIPVAKIRGVDLDQNRLQAAFGVGTVSVLTGGTNYSLGYVEFAHVPGPGTVRETIQERQ